MTANNITLGNLLIFYALLVIPILMFLYFKIKLVKDLNLSAIRMTVQLGLVGIFLQYIFKWNSPFLNISWIILMLLVTNYNIILKTNLSLKIFFLPTLVGLVLGTMVIVILFLTILVKPEPFYDARYLIPITGMILGNCLRSNIMGLERFYHQIQNRQNEYLTYLTLGATFSEATLPFVKEALKTALNPMIASIATIGLVALPGMMTGQILGGSFPITAIKYQIAIMIAIFVSMAISVVLNLHISFKFAFNDYNLLKENVIKTLGD